MQTKYKEEKQKATLYLSPELHRKLKVYAAVQSKTMTDIAQEAIEFYLTHPDVVDQHGFGSAHRVYSCPECATAVVIRDANLVTMEPDSSVLSDKSVSVVSPVVSGSSVQGEGELVPC
jgi:hypothetical protein